MHILFARIIAALLWLEKRLEPIAKHPLGRVGLVLFFVLMTFANGGVVHAGEAGAKEGPGLLETALLFIANIALTVAVVLSKLVIVIIQVLIPVMLYNKFSESPVVVSGWAIVRDTVNMFFVIVLIAIAFGTIFGNARFKWQQQMTRLMIFAIVINFSKTLCGLMIDLGQVIMLTFANAIREIAAGNFVQMLGMGDVYSLSTSNQIFQSAATDSNATGAQAFDWFASALASVFMMFIVLTTMIMLLAILMYRVVMLWILIVISPLAWFVGGAGDLIKSGAYADWWKKFVCLVAIGPVLTFFLWLTLVVAGAGSISDSAGFVAAGSTDTAGGFLTQIFELNRLISFIIAIAMLYAGFDAANSTCSGAGLGMITDNLKGGPGASGGVRAAKAVAGLGARLGAKGGRVGASVGRYGYQKGVVPLAQYTGGKIDNSALAQKTPLKYATSQGREGLYRNVASKAGTGFIGQAVARRATARADKLGGERSALMGSGMDAYKNDSGDSKNATLMRMAKSASMTPAGKREEQALMMDAMGDPARMKELRASGAWGDLWKRHGKDLEANAKGDKNMKAKVDAFKKANADTTGSWGDVKKESDAASLSAFALAAAKNDPEAKKQLEKVDSKFKRSKEELKKARVTDPNASEFMSAHEAILSGKMFGKDDERTKAYTEGQGAIYEGMKPAELDRIPATAIAENLTEGMITKDGSTVSNQLLANKDARVQAALQKRLSDPANAKTRDALLKGAGVENGKVTDSAKFASTLTTNPGSLSYLDDATFNGLSDDDMIELGSGFADTNVLKSAIANYRKDPEADSSKLTMSRIQTILEKDPTPEMIEAQGYLNAQKKSVDEGSRMQKIAAGVKAMPGLVRESVNASIDTSAIGASVENIGQIPELEQQVAESDTLVDNASPKDSNMKSLLERSNALHAQLDAAKATAEQQVSNIAGSDDLSQKLEDEITNQMGELTKIEEQVAKDRSENRFVRETDNKLVDQQKKMAQLNEIKTKVEAAKTKAAEAKAKAAAAKKS
ncbi:hypothetical protein A3C09_03040 [Candidatus Uhrbacteria bacterium RIFCSPHIGHO2_02_FULL_47_44]|uniref:Uncharacterized protein n=1 Tax=Candidatus Uhrbacteria bacterium RIFCSPLOWO2_02_FULL_48_18 TaxID=1802408 RepID=A0A1F7V6N4_9BACT|nr:MAG: hypothetical protein A3C09_03040 [Candidatus Uhrbacteria bacterium RIFCSPHIGHO2_02_FULL_47_44]OGL76903.1 MAG: hypothetical protein A3E97_04440 [Candidatus Uhrbacteria bacterium RIFCSPHIGHO2_12_FULL_47_12]OGL80333.1 MAG: hypothetical protein A3B20_02815 [Candidatus Uhrbacteria bacterium RIFCSPLOWO2_01_FULL_47_17]OGL86192.1 MAG: hypothetical protein A3I41_01305 [Candidatus Uhrbacteria bacterium RIFCSPLOWO2_02_FULL_48_18]OGL93363.1 MAG: hypothetical protein A3H12_04015 [Candidatus Uhrbacte